MTRVEIDCEFRVLATEMTMTAIRTVDDPNAI